MTNLLEFMEEMTDELDRGEPVVRLMFIYLDLQKTFDKVQHVKLMAKLEVISINGKLLNWIREWLNGRKQEW